MEERFVFANKETFIELFVLLGSREEKYYEILIAILLCDWYEKIMRQKCVIGLELKTKYWGKLPDPKVDGSIEVFKGIFLDMVEKDSWNDCVIAVGSASDKFHVGEAIQLKRFGKGRNEKNEEQLIDNIVKWAIHYKTSTGLTLAVLLETNTKINLSIVTERLRTVISLPFKQILYLGGTTTEYTIGAFWPVKWSQKFILSPTSNPKIFVPAETHIEL